ncbi:hypothetical protein [Spongiactinospora gelatinilytica]|uniref:hypothetical protein n=1 Tax=Spongiactinospora gelatinilytica TaxID=2666298 RepID=UPI0011B93CAC|nr:hypothetical protein [Spongiactinospora gelatinilytica]
MDALIGLPLQDAYRACMETIRLVAGFVELQDSLHDRPPPTSPPATWTGSHPPGCETPPRTCRT